MNREQKAATIEALATEIQDSQAIFAVDYRGISVPQAAELRAKLRDADATFRVVKNSLSERAADQAGAASLKELMQGPTALTFVRGDAATAAKAIADYARLTQLLPFKGGIMDGAPLDAEQVRSISRLPSREVLYGQLVGIVASPVSGLVRTLGALLGGLAVALGQVRDQKEAGEIPAGPAVAAGEPTPDPEPTADPTAGGEPATAELDSAAGPSGTAAAEQHQAEPGSAPAPDDNQADASAEPQPDTAEATKED